jgi:dTDP-4-dehydrorhamnose 3,5-epimerase-like enzyme
MKLTETKIKGLLIIEPDVKGDNRGWFMETYSLPRFHEMGID